MQIFLAKFVRNVQFFSRCMVFDIFLTFFNFAPDFIGVLSEASHGLLGVGAVFRPRFVYFFSCDRIELTN